MTEGVGKSAGEEWQWQGRTWPATFWATFTELERKPEIRRLALLLLNRLLKKISDSCSGVPGRGVDGGESNGGAGVDDGGYDGVGGVDGGEYDGVCGIDAAGSDG